MARRPMVFQVSGERGVNLLKSPTAIDDTELILAKNVIPTMPGLLGKRLGLAPLGATVDTTFGNATPMSAVVSPADLLLTIGFILRAPGTGTLTQVLACDKQLTVLSFGQDWNVRSARAPILLPAFGQIYAFYGRPQDTGHAGTFITPTSAGYFDLAGAGNTGVSPAGGCLYRSQLVLWDLADSDQSYLAIADYNAPNTFGANLLAADGRKIPIWPETGDRIVSCIEIAQTSVGNPMEQVLLVLKENSAGVMTGLPVPSTTSPAPDIAGFLADLEVKRFNYSVGCASHHTVCRTPFGVIWADKDDVWMFNTGQQPIRIGLKIRSRLKLTPAGVRYKWHAAYFDGFYRLAIMSQDQEYSDDGRCEEEWRLDLRGGPPQSHEDAAWYGPQIIKSFSNRGSVPNVGTYTMVLDDRPGIDQSLLLVMRSVSSIQIVQQDVTAGYDLTFTPDNSSTFKSWNDDCDIQAEVRSKVYDGGDHYVDKLMDKLEFAPSINMDGKFECTFDGDDGRDQTTGNEIFETPDFRTDASQLDGTDLMTGQHIVQSIEPDVAARHWGKHVAFQVRDVPGFVVGASNATCVVNSTTITLTQGYYADIIAFCDMLVAAMTAALGVTFTHNQATSPRPQKVIITAGTGTWTYGVATASSRLIWGNLGYDVSASPSAGAALTASDSVYNKRSVDWETHEILLFTTPQNRRPT